MPACFMAQISSICYRWMKLKKEFMASHEKTCIFCTRVLDVPRNMCDCYAAFRTGIFCEKYHKHEAGWEKCSSCKSPLHLGCFIALDSYVLTEACGATCKYCVEENKILASNVGASKFSNVIRRNVLADQGVPTLLNNDPHNLGNVADNLSHLYPPYPGLTFLFSKELSVTDCNLDTGRLVLPKYRVGVRYQAFLPMPPGVQTKTVVVKDTDGRTWSFTQRWSVNNNSRKYVFDGMKDCIRQMNWNAGDTLNFYRQLPEDELVMELRKVQSSRTLIVLSD